MSPMMMGKKKTKSNGYGIEALPVDMVMLVFCRLPHKTLGCLRCVSKQLLNLVNLYEVNHLKNKPIIVGVKAYSDQGNTRNTFDVTLVDPNPVSSSNTTTTTAVLEEEIYSVSFKDDGDTYTILYSSGLLLFFGLNFYIRVCDLNTRQIFTISHRNLYFTIQRRLPNPSWALRHQGLYTCFGFLPTTCQHKIVDFFTVYPDGDVNTGGPPIETNALVVTLPSYSSPAGSWKCIPVVEGCLLPWTHYKSRICVSGVMYWLICPYILSFHLEFENFQKMNSPVVMPCNNDNGALLVDLVELQGVVCVAQCLLGRFLDIWFLRKDLNNNHNNVATWVKEYSIDYSLVQGYTDPPFRNSLRRRLIPCHLVVKGGKTKTILFNSTFDGSFYIYSLKDKTFTNLGKHGRDFFQYEFIHYGSLSPVLSGMGTGENCWNILLEVN